MEHHLEENKENIPESLTIRFKLFFKKIPQKLFDFKNNDFFKNHLILWLLLFNFLTNLVNWISLVLFINKTQGNIILHYNVYFGVDNFGNWQQVFWMPAIGLGLFLINLYLAFFFHSNKEVIASYILLIASLMIQLSLIIGAISVILINY
jgi:hypothetical protein